MIVYYISITTLAFASMLPSSKSDQQLLDSCKIGDVLKNECSKCSCSQSFYQCTPTACDKDQQKKKVQSKLQAKTPACHRNMIYIQNSTTCICNADGYWPHKYCTETFGLLPADFKTKQNCEPNTYVFIDCNVCRCNSQGLIDTERCTKNDCKKNSRRTNGIDKVYGSCTSKMWYSFAPCQLCYCVHENKLVCNTGNHLTERPLELGTYKLSVCGETLLKDAVDLVPNSQTSLREGETAEKKETTENKPKSSILKDIKSTSDVIMKPTYTVHSSPNPVQDNFGYYNSKDKEDSDSESVEDNKPLSDPKTMVAKEGKSTQMPYTIEEEDVVSSESNEIPNKITDDTQKSPQQDPQESTPSDFSFYPYIPSPGRQGQQSNKKHAYNSNKYTEIPIVTEKDLSLQVNFPLMLDKLLNLELRKSMVKLDNSGTPCKQGSSMTVDCNTCFCLVNGKMLCTDKAC